MKQLEKLFGDYPVIMYIDESGVAHFEIESVSMAIGYVTRAKGKEYPHKTRINKTLKNAEITPVVHGVQLFMTESQLYSFLIEAHTEKSKAFHEYYGTAEPPVRCGESHLSGLTEPLHFVY